MGIACYVTTATETLERRKEVHLNRLRERERDSQRGIQSERERYSQRERETVRERDTVSERYN